MWWDPAGDGFLSGSRRALSSDGEAAEVFGPTRDDGDPVFQEWMLRPDVRRFGTSVWNVSGLNETGLSDQESFRNAFMQSEFRTPRGPQAEEDAGLLAGRQAVFESADVTGFVQDFSGDALRAPLDEIPGPLGGEGGGSVGEVASGADES